MTLTPAGFRTFRRRLLGWFHRGKRDLPWRRTQDPYRIWLAEIMLQQTRVAAVAPYYLRFLRRFPTVQALARARSDEVLCLWAGLGYYTRARNLRRAAREIVQHHQGNFPRDFDAALRLPGIGRYTAAAILSIAYGVPLAVLDGNVARVLARLSAVRGDLRAPRRWHSLEHRAEQLLAPQAAGNWNQAMMELGATVCTPRAPRCHACPISRWCQAYARRITDEIPTPRRKRPPVKVRMAAAVLLDPRGRTLLVKDSGRHEAALFSRMWQFPAVVVSRNAWSELGRHLRVLLGLDRISLVPLSTARHRVTFREIWLHPFLARVDRLPELPATRRSRLEKLDRLPVSNATRKIAAAARAQSWTS